MISTVVVAPDPEATPDTTLSSEMLDVMSHIGRLGSSGPRLIARDLLSGPHVSLNDPASVRLQVKPLRDMARVPKAHLGSVYGIAGMSCRETGR